MLRVQQLPDIWPDERAEMISFDLMQGILQRTHIFGYSLPDPCCFLAACLGKGRFSSQFSKGANLSYG